MAKGGKAGMMTDYKRIKKSSREVDAKRFAIKNNP